MSEFPSSVKLWRIIKERDNYYYEIRLAGETIDRIRIESPAYDYLKRKGIFKLKEEK